MMAHTSLSKKLVSLRAKTEARGASKAEAEAAAAKVEELVHSEERDEAVTILRGLGWSEIGAKGIVAGFDRLPPWQHPGSWRWQLLVDWASCHQKLDPLAIRTQMRFLTEEMRGVFLQHIGAPILAAKTEEEATKSFEPYSKKVNADVNV